MQLKILLFRIDEDRRKYKTRRNCLSCVVNAYLVSVSRLGVLHRGLDWLGWASFGFTAIGDFNNKSSCGAVRCTRWCNVTCAMRAALYEHAGNSQWNGLAPVVRSFWEMQCLRIPKINHRCTRVSSLVNCKVTLLHRRKNTIFVRTFERPFRIGRVSRFMAF